MTKHCPLVTVDGLEDKELTLMSILSQGVDLRIRYLTSMSMLFQGCKVLTLMSTLTHRMGPSTDLDVYLAPGDGLEDKELT
jgi:hypothetical protein